MRAKSPDDLVHNVLWKWSWHTLEDGSNWCRLGVFTRGIEQYRIFKYRPENPLDFESQVLNEFYKLSQDVEERLDFRDRARRGEFDTSEDISVLFHEAFNEMKNGKAVRTPQETS